MTAPHIAVQSSNDRAAQLRGFGAFGLLAILVILLGAAISPLVSAPLVLVWVVWSQTPWREIGYVRPRSWASTVGFSVLGGVVLKLALKSIVMPLLGAAPVNAAYHYLAHNPTGTAVILLYIFIGAGFAEETFFRGYLFERLGKLLGSSMPAKAAIILLTSVLFGMAHYAGQGIDGVMQATVVGLVFGAIFSACGQLFPLMIAHASFDITAVFLIYFDMEARLAHLFLR